MTKRVSWASSLVLGSALVLSGCGSDILPAVADAIKAVREAYVDSCNPAKRRNARAKLTYAIRRYNELNDIALDGADAGAPQ